MELYVVVALAFLVVLLLILLLAKCCDICSDLETSRLADIWSSDESSSAKRKAALADNAILIDVYNGDDEEEGDGGTEEEGDQKTETDTPVLPLLDEGERISFAMNDGLEEDDDDDVETLYICSGDMRTTDLMRSGTETSDTDDHSCNRLSGSDDIEVSLL